MWCEINFSIASGPIYCVTTLETRKSDSLGQEMGMDKKTRIAIVNNVTRRWLESSCRAKSSKHFQQWLLTCPANVLPTVQAVIAFRNMSSSSACSLSTGLSAGWWGSTPHCKSRLGFVVGTQALSRRPTNCPQFTPTVHVSPSLMTKKAVLQRLLVSFQAHISDRQSCWFQQVHLDRSTPRAKEVCISNPSDSHSEDELASL